MRSSANRNVRVSRKSVRTGKSRCERTQWWSNSSGSVGARVHTRVPGVLAKGGAATGFDSNCTVFGCPAVSDSRILSGGNRKTRARLRPVKSISPADKPTRLDFWDLSRTRNSAGETSRSSNDCFNDGLSDIVSQTGACGVAVV